MKVNKEQKAAILHKKGPALVIAGPGSGKTRVITLRVEELVKSNPLLASHILVVTFTKAAASEMKERFFNLTNNAYSGVVFSTFHSIFYYMLRQAYQKKWEVIGEDKQRKILLQILPVYFTHESIDEDRLKEVLEEIGRIKNHQIQIEHYFSPNMDASIFREIYHHYQSYLQKTGSLDFDDILLYTYKLLKKNPLLRKKWQEKFQYIMIDEFQDINPVQYEIIKLMIGEEENLYIVGDDDQSIYGFRGAAPNLMLGFEKDFPKAKRYELTVNYRCQGNIVKAANQLILNNQKRFVKNIQSFKVDFDKIGIHRFEDSMREADHIAKEVLSFTEKKIGILYRVHTDAHMIVSKLMEYNVPFVMKDQVPNLYNHWIAKDVIAYFNIVRGSYKSGDLLRIMNKPLRYMKRECVPPSVFRWGDLYDYYEDITWMKRRIEEFEEDIDYMSTLSVYRALLYLKNEIGYGDYLKEYAKEKNIDEEDLLNILSLIEEQAKEIKTFDEWFKMIIQYEEKIQRKDEPIDTSKGIYLSTIHSSKGLEYDLVYIIGVNEDSIPYHKMTSRGEIEEERRLLYVGMTRAKEKLSLSFVKKRYQHILYPSRFLKEILDKK